MIALFAISHLNAVVGYDNESYVTLENCLFHKVTTGIEAANHNPSYPDGPVSFIANNCTFHGCTYANATYGLNMEIARRNCIFSGNHHVTKGFNGGIWTTGSENTISWNNYQNVTGVQSYLNPMFAHQKSNGELIRACSVPDGFFLAQEENDVSRRPLMFWDLDDTAGIVASKTWASQEITVNASYAPMGGSEDVKGALMGGDYDDNGRQSNREWPVLLTISGGNNTWSAQDDTLTLKLMCLDNEQEFQSTVTLTEVQVYLPDLTFPAGGATYTFWVAEDGSTFNATGGGTPGSTVTQSANYAMEYDPAGSAACAYNVRHANATGDDWQKWADARSPAVNAGTEDAYDYDSTSTNPDRIDLGQPDVGYHYYRRIGDDDPIVAGQQELALIFRTPKEQALGTLQYFADIGGRYTTFDPQPSSDHVLVEISPYPAVLKGKYSLTCWTKAKTGSVSDTGEVNILIDPNALEEADVVVQAEGVDALDKVHLSSTPDEDGYRTVFFNNSESDLSGIAISIEASVDDNPWQTIFGPRATPPVGEDERVEHFGDYSVFPTPTP